MSYITDNVKSSKVTLNKITDPVRIGLNWDGGEVINLQGVYIQLPKVPGRTNMDGARRSKDKQVWTRFDHTKLKSMSPERAEEAISSEYAKILYGHWIFIKGEPTYITGQHYYYLNYVKLDVGYPEFRIRDVYFFYYWDAAKRDNRCYGVTLVKPRRWGATWVGTGILLRDTTLKREALSGILSKTGEDAKKFFTRKVVSAYRSLPDYLRPINASGTNPKTSLDFTTPSDRSVKKMKGADTAKEEALNSYIEWRSTGENAFDSEKLFRLVYDEIGKIEERINLEDQIDTIFKCMLDGDEIVGKAFCPSTVNRADKGGAQFKKVYYDSKFDKAEEGATPTGLWTFFVSSSDGLAGCIDKFGRSVTEVKKGEKIYDRNGRQIKEGSLSIIARRRRLAKKKGVSAWIEERRKMPETEEEAFFFSSNDTVLDAGRIQQQLQYNESVLRLPVERGDFVWTGAFGSPVKWVAYPEGPFEVSWLPPKEMQNNIIRSGARMFPGNAHFIRGGCDSYDIDFTTDNKGSKGSFHFMTTPFNMNANVPQKKVILHYMDRPKLAVQFFESMLKACIFYGCVVLIENNKYNIATYFIERGYSRWLMDRPKSTFPRGDKNSVTKKRLKGVPMSSSDVLNAHTEALKTLVFESIGEDEDGNIHNFPYEKTLKQCLIYNIDNRTHLDAVMSLGYCRMAIESDYKSRDSEKTKQPAMIKTYKR